MMKRWLAWILILVCFVSGCGEQPEEPVDTTVNTQPKTTDPIRSIYWEGTALEESTDGAVKIYGTEEAKINGIGFLDGDPVVLTAREDSTLFTRIDGSTGEVKAEKLLDGSLFSDSLKGQRNVVMAGSRLAYYDAWENVFRILDGSFNEVSKIKLQHVPEGIPLISANLSQAYYCVGSDIRAMDLKTGISRMVCQWADTQILLMGLLLEDSMLCCLVTKPDGDSYVEFLDAENGVSLAKDAGLLTIESQGDVWLANRMDGITGEILLGNREGEVFGFLPENTAAASLQLLGSGILERSIFSGEAQLRLYDQKDGNILNLLRLEGVSAVYSALEDPNGRYIWFACADSLTKQDVLCRWDTETVHGNDDTVRVGVRYTAENPDTAGLAKLRQEAQRIGQKYGVQIHLTDEIPQVEGFAITYEYQVEAFDDALARLDRIMAGFPEGFFTRIANRTGDKQLHIALIRSVQPTEVGGNPQGGGLHYLLQGNAWIAVCVGTELELNFCHNLSHALDTYVYSNSIHYDFWSNCNPQQFRYDENYLHIDSHADSPYLFGQNRAFIDAFSMTFPHEDRATVFAYALMEDAADYFDSPYMQAKLKQLCMGIREAFGWEKETGTFPWEQYLSEPLTMA